MNLNFSFFDQLPEYFTAYASDAIKFASNNPYIGIGAAVAAIGLIGCHYFASSGAQGDEAAIQKLAKEIVELEPTIGDCSAYDFVATKGKYVDPQKTHAGTMATLAAGLRARQNGSKYGERAEDVVELGKQLLAKKSGQCDHMAASVVAKVVEYIRQGNSWDSNLELVGNGGHAFVIMNREGTLSDPMTWGKKAVIIDTWLGSLGVNSDYEDRLTAGECGVISKPKAVRQHAEFFGAQRFKVTHAFTPQELKDLARQ